MLLVGQSSLDGYGQTVFCRFDAVALVAYYSQGEGRDECRQRRHPCLLAVYPLVDSVGQALAGIVQPFQDAQEIVCQQGRGGCGRFYAGITDHVKDALVAFMTDSRNDGQRELCDVLGQRQRVETAQVSRCTATAQDTHHIEIADALVYLVQGINDGCFYLLALHDGGE